MVTAQQVEAQVNLTVGDAARAIDADTNQGYEVLNLDIQKLESLAREAFQAKLNELVWPVLAKLENGEALTAAEHDMLELAVVGAAKYYVKAEDDVENWKNEVKRLVEAMQELLAVGLDDIDSLMRVRALCREAMRILPDLAYFFQEKERVHNFEAATTGAIDVEARRMLANVVKEMMGSAKM